MMRTCICCSVYLHLCVVCVSVRVQQHVRTSSHMSRSHDDVGFIFEGRNIEEYRRCVSYDTISTPLPRCCTKFRMTFFGSVLFTAKVGQPSPTHRLISLSQLP